METFNTIVHNILHLDPVTLRDEMTPSDIPDWDSMNYLLFIAEIEKQFSVSFSMDEVLGAQSIGDVKNLLRKKGITL